MAHVNGNMKAHERWVGDNRQDAGALVGNIAPHTQEEIRIAIEYIGMQEERLERRRTKVTDRKQTMLDSLGKGSIEKVLPVL